jgi:metal-responsive CopG/Arc/MetJ family transcriptional regulator
MIPVQIRFTKKLIERIDRLIEHGVYSNRSEAIRDATRRLVIELIPKGDLAPEPILPPSSVEEKRGVNG